MAELASEQRKSITKYIEKYKNRLRRELSGEWKKERKERIVLFQRLLARESIDNLDENDVGEIVRSLWASRLWTNKDYLVAKVLNNNGLPRIKRELKALLYGDEPIQKRFDNFLAAVKGLGPSSVTEILIFVFPDKYCLWNEKPKNVLPILGIGGLLAERVYKYAINGKDYAKCNEVLAVVRGELEKSGFTDIDFLDVDIFMWLLFNEEVEKPRKGKRHGIKEGLSLNISKLSHWDIVGLLLELGNLLGYDTYTADPAKKCKVLGKSLGEIALLKGIPPFTYQRLLDTAKNIDVIWFKDEFPAHCFEVEHTTGVTLGLLRLYQIRSFTNARFFVVAPANIINKFQTEITKDPFCRVKNQYRFKSYEELVLFFDRARAYHEVRGGFLGD